MSLDKENKQMGELSDELVSKLYKIDDDLSNTVYDCVSEISDKIEDSIREKRKLSREDADKLLRSRDHLTKKGLLGEPLITYITSCIRNPEDIE